MDTHSPARSCSELDEAGYCRRLLEEITTHCPQRISASDDERRAAEIIADELGKLGLATRFEAFRHNRILHANLVLHFGLGSLGTLVSPAAPHLAFLLHLAAGTSYFVESSRRRHVLRRLLPRHDSQNVVGTIPATGAPELRIVFLAHLDAAFTGRMFDPRVVKRMSQLAPPHPLSFLQRGVALATYSQFALAGIDLARMALGPLSWPLRPIEHALSLPAYIAFFSGLEVCLRREVVPGANDDLSGVVALPVLASRLARAKPPGVELVFVATGCEEAGTGGSSELARQHSDDWDRERTVVVGLDGLSNGEIRLFEEEGEVVRRRAPTWLLDAAERAVARDTRFDEVRGFSIPVGGTDVGPFLAHGYDGVCIGCIDPDIGAPRHYHQPSDSPANLDWDKLDLCIDFVDAFVHEIWRARLR